MKLSQKYLSIPFTALVVFVAGCGDNSQDAAGTGVAAIESGDFATAVKALNRAGKTAEPTSAYFYNLGLAKEKTGDLAGAERAFDNAISADITNLDAQEYKALVLRENGNCAAAHETLDMAIAETQDAAVRARMLNSLAVTEHKLGRDDLAVIRLNLAAVVAPKYSPTYFNMAKIYEMLGLYREALAALVKFEQTASGDDPMRESAAAGKTAIQSRAGNMRTPAAHVNSAAAEKLIKQGNEAFARQKLTLAEEAFAKALAADPKSYDAAFKLGETRYLAKNFDAAAEAYAKAAGLAPDKFDPVFKQAHLAYSVGNTDKAINLLTLSAIPRWPGNTSSYMIASYAYCVEKRYYEARICGEAFLELCKTAGTDTSAFRKWFDTIPQISLQLDK